MSNAFRFFVYPPSRLKAFMGCDPKSQNGGHDGLMEAPLIFFMCGNITSLSWFLSLLMGHVPCNSPMNCVFVWRFLASHFSFPWASFLWLLMISGLFLHRVPLIPSWTSLEVFRQRLEMMKGSSCVKTTIFWKINFVSPDSEDLCKKWKQCHSTHYYFLFANYI